MSDGGNVLLMSQKQDSVKVADDALLATIMFFFFFLSDSMNTDMELLILIYLRVDIVGLRLYGKCIINCQKFSSSSGGVTLTILSSSTTS